ncbi:Y-family DNA polymerase [Staphylococcus aureus]
MTERRIIHIDMDYFFAQVEMTDNPNLKGKRVIVGGKASSRGVVSLPHPMKHENTASIQQCRRHKRINYVQMDTLSQVILVLTEKHLRRSYVDFPVIQIR